MDAGDHEPPSHRGSRGAYFARSASDVALRPPSCAGSPPPGYPSDLAERQTLERVLPPGNGRIPLGPVGESPSGPAADELELRSFEPAAVQRRHARGEAAAVRSVHEHQSLSCTHVAAVLGESRHRAIRGHSWACSPVRRTVPAPRGRHLTDAESGRAETPR